MLPKIRGDITNAESPLRLGAIEMKLGQLGQRLGKRPIPVNVFLINRLRIAPNLEMHCKNQTGMRAAESGVDLQCPTKLSDSLVNQAQLLQGQAQIGMSRREIGTEPNGPAMRGHRLLSPTAGTKHDAKAVVRF